MIELIKSKESPFFGPFCQNLGKQEFPRIICLGQFFSVYSPLSSCRISEKTNERILRKSFKKKSIFGPFLPKFGQTRIFPKNLLRLVFSVYSPLTSCTISEKTNEPILKEMRY